MSSGRPARTPGLRLDIQVDHMLRDLSGLDFQLAYAHRQVKAPWPGAAGVEIEHAILFFNLQLMAMAVDHDAESGGIGFYVELGEVVDHVDRDALDFNRVGCGQGVGPRPAIYVAADGGNGSEFAQTFENFRIANVSSMEDAIRVA